MAKRFTDSAKYRDPWFRRLSPRLKCAWDAILCECDHAGVIKLDLELLSFLVGAPIAEADLFPEFSEKLVHLEGDRYLIPKFIEFQYGTLSPDNRAHASVISTLRKYAPHNDLISPLLGAKDKEKDKDKDKSKEKEKNKTRARETKFDLESVYRRYPRKLGKQKGLEKLTRDIKTEADFQALGQAVSRFVKHHEDRKTDPQYIPHFSTFVGSWRDWCDAEVGTVTIAEDDPFAELRKKYGDLPK